MNKVALLASAPHLGLDRNTRGGIVTGSTRLRKGGAGGGLAAAIDGSGGAAREGLGHHDQLGG